MFKGLNTTVQIAHHCLEAYLEPGGVAVDATVGNGQDTLFLARMVGHRGHIYGFDIQEQALRSAGKLLTENGYGEIAQLILIGHENMAQYVKQPVDVITFNLGYLPGGDRFVTTCPDSTLKAVKTGLGLLKPGGIMSIVVYTGHPGGYEEQQQLESCLHRLDKKEFCVSKLDVINRENAPYLIMIDKNNVLPGRVGLENSET